jgi:hypothetical protein
VRSWRFPARWAIRNPSISIPESDIRIFLPIEDQRIEARDAMFRGSGKAISV